MGRYPVPIGEHAFWSPLKSRLALLHGTLCAHPPSHNYSSPTALTARWGEAQIPLISQFRSTSGGVAGQRAWAAKPAWLRPKSPGFRGELQRQDCINVASFVPALGRKTSQRPLPAPGWQLRSKRCPYPRPRPLFMSHSGQFDLSIRRISVSPEPWWRSRLWWTLPWFTWAPGCPRGVCDGDGGGGRECEARKARTRSFQGRGSSGSEAERAGSGLRTRKLAGSGGRKVTAGGKLGEGGHWEGRPVTPSASPALRGGRWTITRLQGSFLALSLLATPHPVGPTWEGGPCLSPPLQGPSVPGSLWTHRCPGWAPASKKGEGKVSIQPLLQEGQSHSSGTRVGQEAAGRWMKHLFFCQVTHTLAWNPGAPWRKASHCLVLWVDPSQ